MTDLVSKINQKAYWVTNAFDSDDPEDAVRYGDQLKEIFAKIDKYANEPKAKECIEKIKPLLERVEKEARPSAAGNFKIFFKITNFCSIERRKKETS